MPRKPTRRSHLQKPQHAISRLGRSMALINSSRKYKQQNDIKAPSISTGKRMKKHDTIESKREMSCSSSDNEDSSSEDDFKGVVQVDFDFSDLEPDDFHGVKMLMHTYLDNKEWDLTSFVDLILQETTVGTVIKSEEDKDEEDEDEKEEEDEDEKEEDGSVYAFVSALNLQKYKDCKCIMEVKEFLLSMCQDKEIKEKLRSYLESQAEDVCLLISQRVGNLPPQLLPPLFDDLFKKILLATTKDKPKKELTKSSGFKYYLMVSKIYKRKNGHQKKKGNSSTSSEEEDIIYFKPDDEIFHNLCEWSFLFPIRSQQVTDHEHKDYRLMGLVMAVKATSVPTFQQQLHSLIDE